MNKYVKGLILCVAVIVVSVICCYCIAGGVLPDERTEMYYNCVLIVKGIIAAGAIIACSISLAILFRD